MRASIRLEAIGLSTATAFRCSYGHLWRKVGLQFFLTSSHRPNITSEKSRTLVGSQTAKLGSGVASFCVAKIL